MEFECMLLDTDLGLFFSSARWLNSEGEKAAFFCVLGEQAVIT
jgi:hypothetical protein